MVDVVIIGAGLTGLCTAYALESAGFYNYVLYESESRPGGLLRSEHHNGFTFDRTGHWIHISDPGFKKFIDEVSRLDSYSTHERNAHVFSYETLTPYPFQMNLKGLPINVIAECIEGFIKRKKSSREPLTFKQWVLKHFGEGFGKYFFYDYNSKILSYPVTKIHPAWTGRFVPQTTLEQIIAGATLGPTEKKVGYNSDFYYPLNGGIEFLIKAIKQKLKNPIVTSAQVSGINFDTKEIRFADGKQTQYQKLISTAPLKSLLTMGKSSRFDGAGIASKLICNSVININIGFKNDIGVSSDWIYFPEKKYPFYRLGFWHNIAPQLVPAGSSAVYGEFSFIPERTSQAHQTKMTDEALAKMLAFLKFSEGDVVLRKDLHLRYAYVIYDQWRQDNLPKILTLLRDNDVTSTGRYGEWKYSSMQEAYQDGTRAAAEILSHFGKTDKPLLRASQVSL